MNLENQISSSLENNGEDFIFSENDSSDFVLSHEVDPEFFEDELELSQPLLLYADTDFIDYSEKLDFISSNLQVLNCICLLIGAYLIITGFIKLFIKFFGFDFI